MEPLTNDQNQKSREDNLKEIKAEPGIPAFAFRPNYSRFVIITHAFQPEKKEFWVRLDSLNGTLGYLKFRMPPMADSLKSMTKEEFLLYAELIEVHPANFSVPGSADVYKLSLSPQQAKI